MVEERKRVESPLSPFTQNQADIQQIARKAEAAMPFKIEGAASAKPPAFTSRIPQLKQRASLNNLMKAAAQQSDANSSKENALLVAGNSMIHSRKDTASKQSSLADHAPKLKRRATIGSTAQASAA